MWNSTVQIQSGGQAQRVIVRRDRDAVSYAEVLELWRNDAEFRTFFIGLLTNAPYPAYRWETPPITTQTANRHFEFVLLDTPELDRKADPDAFADQFAGDSKATSVITFSNLGGDAVLIVPRLANKPLEYSHLAAFLRLAPDTQKHELWRVVGAAMQARLGNKPVWLSTAGMGVAWLHIRLDSRPKYYGWREYADAGVKE